MKTIATLGPIGYIPRLPGTTASAVGAAISWMLSGQPLYQALGVAAAAALTLWCAGPAAKAMGKDDPSQIVIDEVAGILLALAFLPVTWKVYLSGFLLFRFFDIVKPFPIRQIQRAPGSWGILLDDLLAGALTHLILRALLLGSMI